MRIMDRNCVTLLPIIHPVGISDGISFVLAVAAVSLFGGGFGVWCWFFVFVFVLAVVSLLVPGFFSFFF